MTKNRSNYNPTPVYNRRYARGIIRAQIIKRNGYHNVSETMAETFRGMRSRFKALKENSNDDARVED